MKKTCSHCHLEYDENALFSVNIDGKDELFCCKGCEGVFRILSDAKLSLFYEKLGDSTLTPPKDVANDLGKFDSSVFIDKYTKKIDESCSEISLILDGIHCIACVWLNQKILNGTDGILKVDINYTNNKAKITYDVRKIKISEIIAKIRSIGYDAQAYDPKILENINAKERKDYYTRMIIGVFCTMNIMWIAVAQYLGYFLGMDRDVKDILNFAGFALATPTLFYSGFIFFRSGFVGLKNGFVNMDLLVSIGASLTYFYSIYAALTHAGETYFESVTMIITFILIGKFLEIRSRKSAGDVIDALNSEIPSTVKVICDDNEREVAPESIKVGDIISVVPGEKIVIDGVLLSDNALLDSSMLTGESAFVERKCGDSILSGSINMDYHIRYRATKGFESSMMNNIINLIQDSIHKKPHIQNQANAISYHFSAFVFIAALMTFCMWWYFGGSAERAMVIAVSVIIIACPCALALATPIAVIVGIGEAYKRKLLFKEARFLEAFAKVNMIIFDKTGTLTYGTPKVIQMQHICAFDMNVLAAFVRLNNHPISLGVLAYVEANLTNELDSLTTNVQIKDFRQIAQKGIIARFGDVNLCGGTRAFMEECGIAMNAKCESGDTLNGESVFEHNIESNKGNSYMEFYFAINGRICAVFYLEDVLKDDALATIKYFKQQSMRVVMLSGDKREVVEHIADELLIDERKYTQSPIDKSDFIAKAHEQGYRIVMVGDGINDAIALNKSDIAIAMGRGSDVAIESSDIVLLDERLKSLVVAHKLAKRTYGVIRQNIGISIVYNVITIPLAAMGFIIPLFAALSMSFSSLIVVLNSLKIKRNKDL